MIDLDITKLAVIGVVALVVIGPEKLPTVARMAGSLLGRAQRYINDVKSEVGREMELEELRKMQKDVEDAGQSISQDMSAVETDIHSAWDGEHEGAHFSSPPSVHRTTPKARDFRRKKQARTSAIPGWYKHQTGRRTRVISDAARMAGVSTAHTASGNFFNTTSMLPYSRQAKELA